MSMDYADFLDSKRVTVMTAGLDQVPSLHPSLQPHQRSACAFAIRLGRAALFHDTGMGKTRSQLEWARIMGKAAQAPSLILAPLAVAQQTVKEGASIGADVRRCYNQDDVGPGINVTNYDRIHLFDTDAFGAVVLDESGCLKAFAGATKRDLCARFVATPYRLCCTATPAPNDHIELGNHAEFLGIMQPNDMLHRWFINDTSTASQNWRLKRHGIADFWDWVASWAQCVSNPADLGFDGTAYDLPRLNEIRHIVDTDTTINAHATGHLFRMPTMSATEMHREKKLTVLDRAAKVAELVAAEPDEPWLVWCDTDYEADALKAAISGAVEVRGSMRSDVKERLLEAFSEGEARILVTKPRVAGFGLNWQHCARVAFVGVSFSYESYYQAIRRCWRFGQTRPVDVHVIMAPTESTIWETVTRKADDHSEMKIQMLAATRRAAVTTQSIKTDYNPTHQGRLPAWLTSSKS